MCFDCIIHPKTFIVLFYFSGPLWNNLRVNSVVFCGNNQRLRVRNTTDMFQGLKYIPSRTWLFTTYNSKQTTTLLD